jgi:enamine deaminase RidA (YjgF/YER057c/UK114 family)
LRLLHTLERDLERDAEESSRQLAEGLGRTNHPVRVMSDLRRYPTLSHTVWSGQLGVVAARGGQTVADDAIELVEEMFVQLAGGMTWHGDTMSLVRVASSTVYFSDRPQRVVGHMTTEQFVRLWDEGADSFQADPPQAVLSFADASGELEDAVVILHSPSLDGVSLRYSIEVLEGTIPRSAGPCTLFIEPLGRPLSPASIAEMRRRERHRMRRL